MAFYEIPYQSNATTYTMPWAYTTSAPVFVSSGASVNVYAAPPPLRAPTPLDWLESEVDAVCDLARATR